MTNIHSQLEIEQRIYFIRGFQVILDRDLAELYETETRTLNQVVRRNPNRFPSDFAFQLTEEESRQLEGGDNSHNECLRSQAVILNDSTNHLTSKEIVPNEDGFTRSRSQPVILNKRGKNQKYTPHAFTEHGVAMISSVLNTKRADQVNVSIMRTFIQLRKEKTIQGNFAEQVSQLRKEFGQKLEIHSKSIIEAMHQKLHVSPPTHEVTQNILPINKAHSTVHAIQSAVARFYCVQVQDLRNPTRKKSFVLPRQVAMYVTRKQTSLSFKEIATHFEKDHTTVLHACQKIAVTLKNSPDFQRVIRDICGHIPKEILG